MKFLLKILKRIGFLDKINLVLRNGRNVRIPIIRSIGHEHFFDKEGWLHELLNKLIKQRSPHGCFIDVGVNIGQTLLKVKGSNADIAYFGFEPNPVCIFYVNELCRLNDFHEVHIFPVAISNDFSIRDLEIFHDDPTDSSASIVPGFRKESLFRIKVPIIGGTQVESHFHNISVAIIKIDVEGGELEVLNAFRRIISRDQPIIICEVLPAYSVENTFRITRQNEMESILITLGYSIGRILPDCRIQPIHEIGIHGDLNMVNYIFFPTDKCDDLATLMKNFNGSDARWTTC